MKYLFFIFSFFAFVPYSVFAEGGASLSVLPVVGTHQVGDVFTVSVFINTSSKPINAVEGQVSFNPDELEVSGISEEGSVIGSWTREPILSEEGGISFGGGIAGGFTGDSGKIFSIDFRARRIAQGAIRFTVGAAILADDGMGTNIIESMNAGAYDITAKEVLPVIVQSGAPSPMVLGASSSTTEVLGEAHFVSSSHPDQNEWYQKSDAEFSWMLPPDATAVRLLTDTKPSTTPTKLYSPAITEKTIKDISGGISYFHFQVRTPDGWSEPVHYRFQTDNTKPDEFHIAESGANEPFGFIFDARDQTSGIEKYLIQIDDGPEAEWRDDGSHTYIPPELNPGEHSLFAKAIDFAGNFATSSAVFTLASVSAPSITDFPETPVPGSALFVRGKAESNAAVSLWVVKDGTRAKEHKIASASDGAFVFVADTKAEEGIYRVYAEQVKNGVRSLPSESVLISVSQPKIILFGKIALDYLSVLIPLVTLVLLLVFILVFGWHRWKIFRMTLEKELEKAQELSERSFRELKKEVSEDERILASIGSSEGRTQAEKEMVRRMKKSVDRAEAEVGKDLSTVKQKIKRSVKVKIKKVS